MSMILHPATGFPVGDPDLCLLKADAFPSAEDVESALNGLILSASGWRKIFAADGDESSPTGDVSRADLFLAACMARVFSERLLELPETNGSPVVAVGLDSRPTGPILADIMLRMFLASGVTPRYAFIIAAPEIMAWTRSAAADPPRDAEGRLHGFCYISASHNPPGHNGVKFGFGDGGVLSGTEAGALADRFLALVRAPGTRNLVEGLLSSVDGKDLSRVFSACPAEKRRAVSAYTLFARQVASDADDLQAQENVLDAVSRAASERPVGVVAEMNGSARSLSIDGDFLGMLGVATRLVNAKPRAFVHRIVPEGESLDLCRKELETAHANDASFILGYVPDCDGDRGNLVRWDSREGRAVALEAQEVFSLAVLAELAALAASSSVEKKEGRLARVAVAVNDATSLRVDAIASALGAEVHRAETGEANVVNLARSLREKGYVVRILGEGSNGGNITHPAAVRDPLNTVAALVKLFVLRGGDGTPGLFRTWLESTGRGAEYAADYTLDDVIRSLPAWTTTSVFEERALMRVPRVDHTLLKGRYQRSFESAWKVRSSELAARFGFSSWEAWASVGSGEAAVSDDFGKAGKGGLKVLFRDESGNPAGFLWMRGSGTEPVLRIMADLRGRNAEGEAYLLDWQRSMVEAAVSTIL